MHRHKRSGTAQASDAEDFEQIKKFPAKRRKTGCLSHLVDMPLDILWEIFGHLHPLSILYLARTTKAFRRILMHRSSISVWKAARANVAGFPDCPSDMSEPQWANLAFDTHCNICYRPNIRKVDWVLRIRLCSNCRKQCIASRASLSYPADAPMESWSEITTELWSIIPTNDSYDSWSDECVRQDYLRIKAEYSAIKDPSAREIFVKDRRQWIESINEHAMICSQWAATQACDRLKELRALKKKRYQSIVERLSALGWEDEIKMLRPGGLFHHKLVRVPQLLTDRIWKNIRQPLIAYMEEVKASRLARDRLTLTPLLLQTG